MSRGRSAPARVTGDSVASSAAAQAMVPFSCSTDYRKWLIRTIEAVPVGKIVAAKADAINLQIVKRCTDISRQQKFLEFDVELAGAVAEAAENGLTEVDLVLEGSQLWVVDELDVNRYKIHSFLPWMGVRHEDVVSLVRNKGFVIKNLTKEGWMKISLSWQGQSTCKSGPCFGRFEEANEVEKWIMSRLASYQVATLFKASPAALATFPTMAQMLLQQFLGNHVKSDLHSINRLRILSNKGRQEKLVSFENGIQEAMLEVACQGYDTLTLEVDSAKMWALMPTGPYRDLEGFQDWMHKPWPGEPAFVASLEKNSSCLLKHLQTMDFTSVHSTPTGYIMSWGQDKVPGPAKHVCEAAEVACSTASSACSLAKSAGTPSRPPADIVCDEFVANVKSTAREVVAMAGHDSVSEDSGEEVFDIYDPMMRTPTFQPSPSPMLP